MSKNITPTTEQAAPTLSADSKGSQKAKIVLALCQPGKPLYNFWLSPTQEALQIGAAEIAHSLASKGKSAREIADVFSIIGAANASALKQFVQSNLTLPSGVLVQKVDSTQVLASLGLE